MNSRRVLILLVSLASFPFTQTFAVPPGATITPGSGWSGPTAQPGQVGGGPAADRRPIAHWDAVPYVTVRPGQPFNVGVLAYHINDINRVEFSVNNGPWVPIDSTSLNPQTRTEEYWVTIDPALFSSSGYYEVRARVYPNAGQVRVLQTLASDTIDSRKDSSLFVNVEVSGQPLPHDIRYATLSGNDGNPCTQAQPCQSLLRALNSATNLDGAEIRLGEGYWHNGALSTLPAGNPNQWLTITAAPGANPDNVKMRGWGTSNQYAMPKKIRYYNMTMVDSIVAPLASINYFWADHVKIIDESPTAMASGNCWGPAAQQEGIWYTDVYVDRLCYAPTGTLVRNLDAVETAAGYSADGSPTLVNVKFGRIYGSGVLGSPPIDYHGDLKHCYGNGPAGSLDPSSQDLVIYGLVTNPGSAISARGIACADFSQYDIAIVNTDINFPTYFSLSACGNSASLQVNHFIIENSRFNNGGWCSEGGSTPNWSNYMNNIRIRNTIFENGTTQKMVEPINATQIQYIPQLGSAQTGVTLISPNGTITKSPNQLTYGSGAQVTLQAVPAPGYQFRMWGGDLSGTSASGSITLPTSEAARVKYAYAYFEPTGGPANAVPQVNAGPNQSVSVFPTHTNAPFGARTEVTLAGSATDDGLPASPGRTTVCWTQVSGPTTVGFYQPYVGGSVARFYAPGTYVLRLSASDSSLNASDDVQITIGGAATNQGPQVNAGTDQTITLPSGVSLIGTATDDGLPNPPGAITRLWTKQSGPGTVTFGNASAAATTANFSQAGTYILRLTANDSALSAFDDVQVIVNSVANQAPQVNAGIDQTITLPSGVNLTGVTNDDGLPNPPGVITRQWTKQSGPGTVTFGNAGAAVTTANFSQAGTYILRLTANDSALSAFDDVQIVVNPVPNQAPQVNAGPNQAITLPTNLANLSGTATDDGLPNPPGAVTLSWTRTSGPATVTFGSPNAANTTVTFPQAGTYVLRLTVNDGSLSNFDEVQVVVNPAGPTNQAPLVNAGPNLTITMPSQANLVGSAVDDGLPNPPGATTQQWTKQSGPGTVTFGNASAASTTASFSQPGTYILRLTASDSALTAFDDIQVTVNPVANQAPQVNGGSNQTVTMPGAANVIATASDDGLPNPPGALIYVWVQLNGPAPALIVNATQLATSISFSQSGVYTFRIYVYDGALLAEDDVQITVNPPANLAPVVNGGPNQTVTLPSSANLSATLTDDGLPNPPGALQHLWAQLSGPAAAQFASPNALATTVTFPQAGVYVLRIHGYDGELLVWDDVQITVNTPANQGPSADAGEDQEISFPSSADLSAEITDDGLPNPPGAITIQWSKVSGPGAVTFGTANGASTSASFSQTGSYVLRLTVSDSVLTDTDDIQITVNGPASFAPSSGPTRFLPCMNLDNESDRTNVPLCFYLEEAGETKISIYNRQGEHLIDVMQEFQPAGLHLVRWDRKNKQGASVGSGICTAVLNGKIKTKVPIIR